MTLYDYVPDPVKAGIRQIEDPLDRMAVALYMGVLIGHLRDEELLAHVKEQFEEVMSDDQDD